jgi:hypothetical protein
MEDWQRVQEHQQQMLAVAAASKRNERSEVVTLTRQTANAGSPMIAPLMQQHRCVRGQCLISFFWLEITGICVQ